MKKGNAKSIISYINIALVVFTIAAMAACTAYYIEVRGLPQPETNLLFIQPCYFAIMACGLVIILKDILKARKEMLKAREAELPEKPADAADAQAEPETKMWSKVTAFLGKHKEITLMTMSVVYLLILEYGGFLLSVFFFLALVLYIVGAMNRSIWKILLVSALVDGILYLAFVVALQVKLPTGFLGF